MSEETKKPASGEIQISSEKGEDVKVQKDTSASRALGPFDEMERFFDNFFPRGWMSPFRRDWPAVPDFRMPFEAKMPRVDVIDRDDEIVVRAETPGVEKKDLDVSLTDNTVTIKGTSKHEKTVEKGDYYRAEMSRGSFARTVGLPGDVDGSKAKAVFKDGILELVLPKVEKSKRRTVKVE